MSEDFSLLKVTELKDLLREKGLTVSGLKHELVERLQSFEQKKNVKREIPVVRKAPVKIVEIKEVATKKPVAKAAISKIVNIKNQLPSFNSFDDELLDFFGDAETYTAVKNRLIEESDQITQDCSHDICFEVEGINICRACGCEVEKLDFQPEWRYYGAADNRTSKDPSRCHRSKESTRGGIEKVFQDAKLMYLPQAIRKKAEEKYKKIVGKETVRGRKRKSIVAACLLYTFRDEGDIRTSDEVRKMFTGATGHRDVLSKQEMSDGLRRYHSVFKGDRTQCIKPSDLIRRTMHLTKITFDHYKYILRIAKCLDGVDCTLNRSSPQSVASAVVYLYLCFNPEVKTSLGLTKTRFAKEVKLSDITISKLVKKSAEILGLQVEM
jgi:transcription initiation factor TFIIIB Brf1 subunit/transcription initiation factor TFIIB